MANNAKHELDHNSSNRSSIFGTDGIRGNAKKLLTPSLVIKIGFSCGLMLPKKGPVLIGQDSRESSSMITAALIAGLTSAGRDVWQLGLCPTPAVPILIRQFEASGGLMVSASHNPPEDNGIKVFSSNGHKINSSEQKLIEQNLHSQTYSSNHFGKSYQRNDLLKFYEKNLLDSIGNQQITGIPIVLDLCWGSATAFGEQVFKALGAKVTVINGEADGSRINLGCGSTNLKPLKKAILENNAQMGFAFDGDADRIIAIDEKGRVMNGDHILYLWGSYLKERNELVGNRLVVTMMSNLGFEKAWIAKGGVMERTPVGDQYVHEKMIASKADLGGEQSGHILSTINGLCGDGLLTAIHIACISKKCDLNLSKWLDQSFHPYPQKLINIPLRNKLLNQSWEDNIEFKDLLNEAKLALGDEGRILIRESGTEPLLRIMVESNNQEMVNQWSNKLAKLTEEVLMLSNDS